MQMQKRKGRKGRYPREVREAPTFLSWQGMVQRCTDKKAENYKRYGGAGVRICARWLSDFYAFKEDMGDRPCGTTIDRVDSSGSYSCGYCKDCILNSWSANCRWATLEEQANNRSNNRIVEHNGEKLTLAQWARKLGIGYGTLQSRLERGKPLEEALVGGLRSGEIDCCVCKKRFTPATSRIHCCSARCTKLRNAEIAAQRYRDNRPEPIRGKCQECGQEYVSKLGARQVFCGGRCRKNFCKRRWHRNNRELINERRREMAAKRRAERAQDRGVGGP